MLCMLCVCVCVVVVQDKAQPVGTYIVVIDDVSTCTVLSAVQC